MKRKKSGCVSRERRRRTKKGNPGERKEEGRKERVRRRGPLGPSDPRRNSSCNSRSRIAPGPSGGAQWWGPSGGVTPGEIIIVRIGAPRARSSPFGRVRARGTRAISPSITCFVAQTKRPRARARVKYPLGEKIDRGD